MSRVPEYNPLLVELLPTEARTDFNYWRGFIEPLLKETRGIYQALTQISQRSGQPFKTVRNRYYAAKNHGLFGLVDKRLAGPSWWMTTARRPLSPVSQSRGLQELWKKLCERNGRKSRPEYETLVRMWKQRDPEIAAIPEYSEFPGWPALPCGWTYANLMRYGPSDYELEAVRRGKARCALVAPGVFTTRKGLYVGSHYLFDDKWHDFFVNSFAEKRHGRPLEVYSLDLFSACKRRWGVRVRTQDDEGNYKGVAGVMMRYVLAATLYLDGYSPRGTTIVAEHGTANVREQIAKALAEISGGLIKVSESGMQGDPAHIGQYPGLRRGNPRHKAALESNNNLEHNAFAALPGQTGRNVEERPEQLSGLLSHNADLLAAYSELSPDRAALLEFPLLELNQFMDLASEIYARIADRREHDLEGWIESGNILQAFSWGGQLLLETQLNAQQRANLPVLLESGMLSARPIKMTRREVWDRGSGELVKLPGWGVCAILGDDLAREVNVRKNMIEIEDIEIGPGVFRFETFIVDAMGNRDVLRDGEKYQAFINPFAPDTLFVRDAKGRYVGECRRIHAPCRGDIEGVARAMGEAVKREAELLAPVRARHLQTAKDKLALHRANVAALDDSLPAPRRPSGVRAEKHRNRAAQLAALSEAQSQSF
jgi:hypothetical protein